MKKNRLSIFIDSFDGNSDIWPSFFTVFNRFWPNCSYPRYLVSNYKDCNEKGITVIKTEEDKKWIPCTLRAIKKIETKYIFFLLEDYFFSKTINEEDIEEILDYMDEHDIYFYRMSYRSDLDKSKIRQPIKADPPYVINLQPVIWKRNIFEKYLSELSEKGVSSPWDFERHFIEFYQSHNDSDFVPGVMYDTRDLMGYKNAIIQGKWVRKVIKYYDKNTDIRLNIGGRPLLSVKEEMMDNLKQKGHKLFSFSTRKKMKKILSKIGIKFMTKY